MKIQNIFTVLMLFLLSACGAPPATNTAVDPFVAVESAQRTAQAAQEQADYYSRQLTATAEAPIIAITSTAAAFAMEQRYAQATIDSAYVTETSAATQTAMSWTPTPMPTATPNLTATMSILQLSSTAQVMANDVAKDNLSVERARTTNTMRAMSGYVIGFIGLIAGLMFAVVVARKLSVIAIPVDANGKAQPMFDIVEGVTFDTARITNGALATKRRDVINLLPPITAERQDATTSRDQLIELRSRSRAMERLQKNLSNVAVPETSPFPVQAMNEDGLFPLPAWDIVNGWNRQNKDLMPVGNSDKGLEYWDLRNHPHLAIFGKSGSGKSRRGLRPLVTFMLASNQRVILIGKESDYLPFIGHPNAVFVPIYDITERAEAEKYAQALTACVEEKNRRIRLMAQNGVSLWPNERTFIVLDELGNALIEMDSDLADLAMKKSRSMVNEGRKAGMSFVFSAQRPKGFVDLTTQCGRAVFAVETDQERNYALGMKGAERLPEIPSGYFYKKFSALQLTGAFEPNDDEIRAYLSQQQPRQLSKADWIDGIALPSAAQPAQLDGHDDAEPLPQITYHAAPVSTSEYEKEIMSMAESIRARWHPSLSKSKTSELLGKSFAGSSWVRKVNDVIEYLKSTTTPTTTEENGSKNGFLQGFDGVVVGAA